MSLIENRIKSVKTKTILTWLAIKLIWDDKIDSEWEKIGQMEWAIRPIKILNVIVAVLTLLKQQIALK